MSEQDDRPRPGPRREADDETQQDAGMTGGRAGGAQDEERVGADEDGDEDTSS